MIRTFLMLGLFALLTATVCADEPPSSDAKVDPKKVEAARWELLQNQLKEIRQEIVAVKTIQETQIKDFGMELNLLRERLNALEKSVKDISSTRIAAAFTPPPAPPMGIIRLQNRSSVPTTIILAGRSYRLPPLETVMLQSQPAGNFTYEVFAEGYGVIQPPLARTLLAGETFSIFVNP